MRVGGDLTALGEWRECDVLVTVRGLCTDAAMYVYVMK